MRAKSIADLTFPTRLVTIEMAAIGHMHTLY